MTHLSVQFLLSEVGSFIIQRAARQKRNENMRFIPVLLLFLKLNKKARLLLGLPRTQICFCLMFLCFYVQASITLLPVNCTDYHHIIDQTQPKFYNERHFLTFEFNGIFVLNS